jgi:osmotically-inducible protein OsmY
MKNDRHATKSSAGLAVAVALALAACDPVGMTVGAGATIGLAGAQERGLKGAANDIKIRTEINALLLKQSFDLFRAIDLEVVEGRVLLTGKVKDPDTRVEAVRLAWQADGVNEVINEIQVADRSSLIDAARDIWISAQLKTRLTFDREVQAINYSIETVNAVVYIMGLAQNDAEIDRVVNHARNLGYVKRVISYARLKSDPKRFQS